MMKHAPISNDREPESTIKETSDFQAALLK